MELSAAGIMMKEGATTWHTCTETKKTMYLCIYIYTYIHSYVHTYKTHVSPSQAICPTQSSRKRFRCRCAGRVLLGSVFCCPVSVSCSRRRCCKARPGRRNSSSLPKLDSERICYLIKEVHPVDPGQAQLRVVGPTSMFPPSLGGISR